MRAACVQHMSILDNKKNFLKIKIKKNEDEKIFTLFIYLSIYLIFCIGV